jgi:glycosyltransferase involved in cell wall biosynthesis
MYIPTPFSQPIVSPQGAFLQQAVQQQPATPVQQEAGLPRFLNYAGDYSGCGAYRLLWPEYLINMIGAGMSSTITSMIVDPRWYSGVKAIKFQRQASPEQKEFMKYVRQISKEHNFKMIYEVDDVVFREDIPDYNRFKFAFDSDEIRNNCIDMINICDEVTLTCDYIRNLYKEKTGKKEITVIPNFVPYFWMGHLYNPNKVKDQYLKNKRKPRVLYTGSGAHYDVDNKNGGIDDFSHVIDMVRRTVDKYQWIFVGSYPPKLADLVLRGKVEYHPWKSLQEYPSFINDLNAQAMIAPLFDNSFNRSKSDIKYIEACTLGLPCLLQDMETYKDAPEFLKFKTGDDLEAKLDRVLGDRKAYNNNIAMLREIGESRFLERPENIGCHIEALTTPYGSPDRKYLKKWNP